VPADAFDAMQNKAEADGGDATTRHMAQLQDHFFATAAARPENAIDTLVLMAMAHTCWDKGVRVGRLTALRSSSNFCSREQCCEHWTR